MPQVTTSLFYFKIPSQFWKEEIHFHKCSFVERETELLVASTLDPSQEIRIQWLLVSQPLSRKLGRKSHIPLLSHMAMNLAFAPVGLLEFPIPRFGKPTCPHRRIMNQAPAWAAQETEKRASL